MLVLAYCSLHHRIIRLVYVVCATCALVGMAKSTIRTAGWAEKNTVYKTSEWTRLGQLVHGVVGQSSAKLTIHPTIDTVPLGVQTSKCYPAWLYSCSHVRLCP